MPEVSALAAFAIAFVLSAMSPGPTTVTLLARTLVLGASGALPFILGIIVGDIVWLSAAIVGLSALAARFATVFLIVKYLGVLYLAWLAFKLWTATPPAPDAGDPVIARARGSSAFFGALALGLGNPKVIAFYLALLPNLLDLERMTLGTYIGVVLIVAVGLLAILGAYTLAAVRARRLLASSRAVKAANRVAATALIGAAVAVASR